MPAPTCTDGEFIELWGTHKSVVKVAAALGCTARAVNLRRRDIEHRYHINLDASDARGQFYRHFGSPAQSAARRHLTVRDGVVLVFSDAHFWPGVRTTAFRALLLFARMLRPAAVINNGDAFDGASISRYPRIGWDSKPSVIDELKACRDRLGECQEAAEEAGSDKLFWTLGNHDARFETRLAQNAPEYEGVKGFSLKDHFPAWAPCWSVWINGNVIVKHRWKGGIHAGHNNTMGAGMTMVTGHDHNLGVTPFDDYTGTRWGVRTGTLADPHGPQFVDYTEDNPKNWRSGFAVLTFHEGRLLWPELCRVLDETHVDFRGTVIEVPQ